MAEDAAFFGTWKIVECVSLAGTVEPTGIEGTEFHLDESGDITWKVPDGAENMPFFSCETYEVSTGSTAFLKFFGSFPGHMIEFRVEVSDDLMLLTYEHCCMLQCQKTSLERQHEDMPFSFINALEEGYFSDLTLVSSSGREFHVHRSVLRLAVPACDWSTPPRVLEGQHEDVLYAILHFLYAECLPQGLSEDTARAAVKTVHKVQGFEKLTTLCNAFLKNTALRQQITSLVSDMHTCADRIIDLFSGKSGRFEGTRSESERSHDPLPEERSLSNPSVLCYVVKQSLREAAVAGGKLLILCDLFSRRKGELSREERHDIIKYAKSRLPVFMSQLRRLLEVCKTHCSSFTVDQRYDIATYLVPEIELAFDTISTLVIELKTALEQVISSSSGPDSSGEHRAERSRKGHLGDVLGKSLRNALHMRELMKLNNFHQKMTQSFMNLMQKKENFSLLTQEAKIRSVARNLEQLIDEVPAFLIRVEKVMAGVDEMVTWQDWKYLFKLSTSKVAWTLSKMQAHRTTLDSLIQKSIDMIHHEHFTHCLQTLDLLPPPSPQDQQEGSEGAATQRGTGAKAAVPTKYAQLSSVESLCKSPYARDSSLAQNALQLLQERHNTDMVFEIIQVQESGDVVVDHTHGASFSRTDHEREVDVHSIPAHCVVIATRCDWFRRALLSGMKESIDKKITVHDTNPELFKKFLAYLYSGEMDTTSMSIEQLADMIALADRYEVDQLKTRCEFSLQYRLNDDTALFMLSLADQFQAKSLRSAALQYITEHPAVRESEVFGDLAGHLQAEIRDAASWDNLEMHSASLLGYGASHTQKPGSTSSVSEVDDLMSALDLMDRGSSSGSSEEVFIEDSSRMEECVASLRAIIGSDVSREELIQVILAADYDSNRALNFFFSS